MKGVEACYKYMAEEHPTEVLELAIVDKKAVGKLVPLRDEKGAVRLRGRPLVIMQDLSAYELEFKDNDVPEIIIRERAS